MKCKGLFIYLSNKESITRMSSDCFSKRLLKIKCIYGLEFPGRMANLAFIDGRSVV